MGTSGVQGIFGFLSWSAWLFRTGVGILCPIYVVFMLGVSVPVSVLFLIKKLLLVLLNTGNLASNTTSITGHFRVPSVIVKLAVITFNASTPRLAIDVSSTLGNDTSVTVNGIIKDGAFGALVVINYATLFTPVTVAHGALGHRVPLYVLSSFTLLVYTGSILLSDDKRGVLDVASNLLLLYFFAVFLDCAFTVTGESKDVGRPRGRRLRRRSRVELLPT